MASLGACGPWMLEALEFGGPGGSDAPGGRRPLQVGGPWRLETLEVKGSWRSKAFGGQRLRFIEPVKLL